MGGSAAFSSAEGSGDLAEPLSAQAQAPRRPSGADKKQKPAKKEGGQGRSRNREGSLGRSTPNSRHFAANQHCQTLEKSESSAKTVDGSLPGPHFPAVLDEKYGRPQCQKMVSRGDLVMGDSHPRRHGRACPRHPRPSPSTPPASSRAIRSGWNWDK